jgi:hypothetical protein
MNYISNFKLFLERKNISGTYNEIVNDLSRSIFNSIKNEKDKFETYFVLDEDIYIDVYVELVKNKENKHKYNISGDSSVNDLSIKIEYNDEYFPKEYNNLLAEIKEVIRHEIEHINQFNFNYKIYQKYNDITYKEYLLLRHEIPAFVKGLYKRAKTKKIPLNKAFDEFYDENKDNISYNDWLDVKEIWTNWAMWNLPNAIFE